MQVPIALEILAWLKIPGAIVAPILVPWAILVSARSYVAVLIVVLSCLCVEALSVTVKVRLVLLSSLLINLLQLSMLGNFLIGMCIISL